MDVTVVIATYGAPDRWNPLADKAAASVPADVPIVRSHDTDLHTARNAGLAQVATGRVCFLDADDELEIGFFRFMERGTADLLAPSVRYVKNDRQALPRMPRVAGHAHACTADCLPEGNWLVIGTVAPTALLRQVGAFRPYPMYEDWDLWVRCWHAGATIEPIPDAIYRAHVRDDSRNRGPGPADRLAAHQAIARANGLPVPA